jgi:thiol-disulfide isomerase/thioredoxin
MNRRDALRWLPALSPALSLAGPSAVSAAPAVRGQAVTWPTDVRLLDGSPWLPQAGQAQVIVIWSTTCPFCKRHNAHVQKLHQALAGRAAAVLGVARDRDPAAVQRSMALNGWTFPVTLAWPAMSSVLTARNVIPMTLTIDRQGRLQEAIPGEMFEEDVLKLAALAD